MRRDPTEFRKRFAAYKNGKLPYKGGRPSAISEVDKSDADFAERLRSNWRQETWDWEGSGKAVTHKIGSADNIVYPNVQTTKGGGLIDFTNPIWKGVVDPLNRAIINKDYVPMKTEQDAIWFGPNYKKYYPKFKDGKLPKYGDGTPEDEIEEIIKKQLEQRSDATAVQRQEPVQSIKRNFIAEAQRKHAAEAVGPDMRSSYRRKQSQAAKQYANQQYQKAKDDAKRAEGLEQMMKTVSPSTYIEATTGQDLGTVGRFVTDAAVFGLPGVLKHGISKVLSTPILGKWVYNIPEDANMAYRIMGPLERDWLMQGNELSTRATNIATEAEAAAARTKGRINLFKAGAEHGGRKQFAKGQPWHANTTTHGEKQILAIPGEDLPWVSGKHYRGPQGNGWGAGEISFDEAPFGSHIDLLTDETGFSGINPSQLSGSVIYSPFHMFGKKLGYRMLYPKNTSTDNIL